MTITTAVAPASSDVLATLTSSLQGAAQATLPYIGVGVAAGVVVLAVTWGIRKAVSFARGIGEDGSSAGGSSWKDEYDHAYNMVIAGGGNEFDAHEAGERAADDYQLARDAGL